MNFALVDKANFSLYLLKMAFFFLEFNSKFLFYKRSLESEMHPQN